MNPTPVKPTKEQFLDYESIRMIGVTNMFDVKAVCSLSHTGLKSEHCLYIFKHYPELTNEYGIFD